MSEDVTLVEKRRPVEAGRASETPSLGSFAPEIYAAAYRRLAWLGLFYSGTYFLAFFSSLLLEGHAFHWYKAEEFDLLTPAYQSRAIARRLPGAQALHLKRASHFVLIERVLVNVLDNAIKYSPARAPIEIQARLAGNDLQIKVQDRGPGIPKENSERIFEPFFSTKRSTGLGLSICYAIARQHEAEIKAESRPGGGAAFTLIFKAAEEAHA